MSLQRSTSSVRHEIEILQCLKHFLHCLFDSSFELSQMKYVGFLVGLNETEKGIHPGAQWSSIGGGESAGALLILFHRTDISLPPMRA